MAKMEAKAKGADDAWLFDKEGNITEGTSNNAYIVTKEGVIITRHLSNGILSGITRKAVLALAEESDVEIEVRAFTPEEAKNAQEAFITSASTFVMPVNEIDGSVIGNGKAGPITRRLRELYVKMAIA